MRISLVLLFIICLIAFLQFLILVGASEYTQPLFQFLVVTHSIGSSLGIWVALGIGAVTHRLAALLVGTSVIFTIDFAFQFQGAIAAFAAAMVLQAFVTLVSLRILYALSTRIGRVRFHNVVPGRGKIIERFIPTWLGSILAHGARCQSSVLFVIIGLSVISIVVMIPHSVADLFISHSHEVLLLFFSVATASAALVLVLLVSGNSFGRLSLSALMLAGSIGGIVSTFEFDRAGGCEVLLTISFWIALVLTSIRMVGYYLTWESLRDACGPAIQDGL